MDVNRRQHVGRRLLAGAIDLLVVAGWALASGLLSLVMRELDLTPTAAGGWDVAAFLTLVLPVIVTYALFEASAWQATPGKRRLGLRVMDRAGARLGVVRSLARSAVKLAPWQAAHTAVFQLSAGGESMWLLALSVGAQLVALASILVMAVDREHRALHDMVAGARVATGGT